VRRTVSGPTIVVAVILFLIGGFIGFKLLTTRADTLDTTPTCQDRTIAKGEKLTSNLVKVNVFNDSQRAGLANRVSINLQRRGFLSGTVANSASEIKPGGVAILTTDRDDPRVKLVAQQFDGVEYHEPDIDVPDGVTVIVGDDYKDLAKASRDITSDRPITVCVATVEVS
jgi:hypothetical protein